MAGLHGGNDRVLAEFSHVGFRYDLGMFDAPAAVIGAFEVLAVQIQHQAISRVADAVRVGLEFAVGDAGKVVVHCGGWRKQKARRRVVGVGLQQAGPARTQRPVGVNLEGAHRKAVALVGTFGQVVVQILGADADHGVVTDFQAAAFVHLVDEFDVGAAESGVGDGRQAEGQTSFFGSF